MRDNSPPDATRESGAMAWPGFVAVMNSIRSPPAGPGASPGAGRTSIPKAPSGMPSARMLAVTSVASSVAALRRASVSWPAHPDARARHLATWLASAARR